MGFGQAFAALLVVGGIGILLAALLVSRKVGAAIPAAVHGRWRFINGLIWFFLGGYILFVLMQIKEIALPVEYVTSTVFFGGAIFVFLLVKMSLVAIHQMLASRERIAKMHEELQTTYQATIEGWGRALELRDHATEGHTKRVSKMTLQLAGKFDFTGAELRDIKLGALLHDIGKMGIPDRILLKEGVLSAEEKRTMERHPELAMTMLTDIPFLRQALAIPYNHHERWDGSGYPRGLQGEEIPLAARIFAVADVWDALRSNRPYHESWSAEQVCAYIRDQAGRQFDPAVVAVFMAMDFCAPEA